MTCILSKAAGRVSEASKDDFVERLRVQHRQGISKSSLYHEKQNSKIMRHATHTERSLIACVYEQALDMFTSQTVSLPLLLDLIPPHRCMPHPPQTRYRVIPIGIESLNTAV